MLKELKEIQELLIEIKQKSIEINDLLYPVISDYLSKQPNCTKEERDIVKNISKLYKEVIKMWK